MAFRPVFASTGASIQICGFVEARDAAVLDDPWLNLETGADREKLKDDRIRSNANLFGQPVIIGAKRNLPNFKKLVLQTKADISRNPCSSGTILNLI